MMFQSKGILPKQRSCANGHAMKLYVGDDVQWKCTSRSCQGVKKSVRMRVGNWFQGSRIPFVTALRFIYCWAWELTSMKFCERELGISQETTVDWSAYMREVCAYYLLLKPERMIGGPGLVVEIDESVFTRRKYNVGRILPQRWVFGGVCRETGECFLVEVPNRSAATLLDVIKQRIKLGTTIMSDCWKAYKTDELNAAGYEHLKVNHTYNFIDPETGASTQKVERMWGSAKWRNKRHRGTATHHLESYLCEFMFRQEMKSAGEDCYEAILHKIAQYWPPEEKLE